MKFLRAFDARWRGARLSKIALGKYIVMFASLLHLVWAGLLLFDKSAGNSTPVAILTKVCGGPYRTAFVLVVVAVAAMIFPFIRYRISTSAMSLMLIPQQTLLLMSAGAGVYAAVVRHYADGVIRPWPFILSDQLPVILLAVLYTVAVLESAFEPIEPFVEPLELLPVEVQ
jgi:hypothetical protein